MTTNVLLVYPQPSVSSPQKSPPLSILHVGESLKTAKERGLSDETYSVRYVDCRYDDLAPDDYKWADVVGVSSMTGHQLRGAISTLKAAKSFGKRTILGGIHVTMQPEQCLAEDYVDSVVLSEGELAVIDAIHGGKKQVAIRRLTGTQDHVSPVSPETLIHFKRSARTGDTVLMTSRGCPFRCGFSLSGETLIPTSDGLLRMDEICGDQPSILSVDLLVATDNGWKEANYAINEGEIDAFEIETFTGLRITASDVHKFRVLTQDGEYAWKEVKDLEPGVDWIPIQYNFGVFPSEYRELMPIPPREGRVNKSGYRSTATYPLHDPLSKVPTLLTEDLAWIVGFLVGDGTIEKKRSQMKFNCIPRSKEQLLPRLDRVFGSTFKCRPDSRSKKVEIVGVANRQVWDTIVYGVGLDVNEKHKIPKLIRMSPRSVLEAFLDGLCEADAHNTPKEGFILTTSKRHLADDVAMAWLSLGHRPTIRTTLNKAYGGVFVKHIVCRDRKSSLRFTARIAGGFGVKKPNWLYPFMDAKGSKQREQVLVRTESDIGADTREQYYVPLKSVSPIGKRVLYDISVPDGNSFVANGFVAHNCYIQKFFERSWQEVDMDRWRSDVLYLKENGVVKYEHGDDFIGKWSRAREIISFLHKNDIQYRPSIRAHQVDNEVAREMAEMGIKHISVGMETASARMLKLTKKDITIEHQYQCAESLAKHGIHPLFYWILKMPTETVSETNETLDHMDQMAAIFRKYGTPLTQNVYCYVPLPGSPLFDLVDKNTLPKSMMEWSRYSLNQTNDEFASSAYWIGGLHFHKGKGDKTDRNFPGLMRLMILPFEIIATLRWRLRWFGHYKFEKMIIETLLKWATMRYENSIRKGSVNNVNEVEAMDFGVVEHKPDIGARGEFLTGDIDGKSGRQ